MKEDRLAELYRTHGPAIYERCRRLLKNEAAAEDATQEAFLKAHRHLGSAPEDSRAYAWLFRIATNVCLNHIRDAGAHLVKQRELGSGPGDSRDIREVLEDRVLAQSLVLRVPEKLGLPAWLYYVDGLSQEEIAEVLEISRGTVISRLEEFREHGRKWLGLER
jgi:RNA polymerase sigma-70 factor, ECF subfamily